MALQSPAQRVKMKNVTQIAHKPCFIASARKFRSHLFRFFSIVLFLTVILQILLHKRVKGENMGENILNKQIELANQLNSQLFVPLSEEVSKFQ